MLVIVVVTFFIDVVGSKSLLLAVVIIRVLVALVLIGGSGRDGVRWYHLSLSLLVVNHDCLGVGCPRPHW